MSIALLPCILLTIRNRPSDSTNAYSIAIAIFALLEWNRPKTMAHILLASFGILVLCRGDMNSILPDNGTIFGAFTVVWWLMGRIFSNAVTQGEFFLVRGLAAIAVTECWIQLEHDMFACTAIAGVVGCTLSCGVVHYRMTKALLLLRLLFIAVGTLGTVEAMFWWRGIDAYDFPRCLHWIWFDFLLKSESTEYALELPRAVWLIYWGIVMLITIPLAPGSHIRPILARKWFHFVAIVLFVPSTLLAPQMQSLSYAVALCVLMIMEPLRRDVPLLNAFYRTYLDASKQESDEETIISHMALIVGCAAPLWLWQWQGSSTDTRHVALWGVWVLGAGDSMAAIAGTRFGRHRWGDQKRTVEGSMAMALVLFIVTFQHASGKMTLAIALATLLEAFTLQLDNIVLPLVGYVILAS